MFLAFSATDRILGGLLRHDAGRFLLISLAAAPYSELAQWASTPKTYRLRFLWASRARARPPVEFRAIRFIGSRLSQPTSSNHRYPAAEQESPRPKHIASVRWPTSRGPWLVRVDGPRDGPLGVLRRSRFECTGELSISWHPATPRICAMPFADVRPRRVWPAAVGPDANEKDPAMCGASWAPGNRSAEPGERRAQRCHDNLRGRTNSSESLHLRLLPTNARPTLQLLTPHVPSL